MRRNAMDGLPRENINMVKNLKDMIVCNCANAGCVNCLLKIYVAQLQATYGRVHWHTEHTRHNLHIHLV
jgi:hypothetical protein